MAIATRRSKYGSLNWGDHLPTVKHLYLDQKMTLAEVAKIMEREHNFAPSIGAYKRQFKARGWGKNSTAEVARSVRRQRHVAARTKRTRTATRANVDRPVTPIDVTYEISRDFTELPVPEVLEVFQPDETSSATSVPTQKTDTLADARAMVVDPITDGIYTTAGASNLVKNLVNEHHNHDSNRCACGGESSHQSGPDFSPCPTATDAILPHLSQEGQDIITGWKIDEYQLTARADMFTEPFYLDQHDLTTPRQMDELLSPRLADIFSEPLSLDQLDLSTPRQTQELLSPGVVFLENLRFSTPPPTIPLDRHMNQSLFAKRFGGSPWSLFQSAIHSVLSTNAATSMTRLEGLRGTDTRDIQPSLSDLVYSMLPHSDCSTAARNLGSALEQVVSIYFPADEAQRLQLGPALTGNSSIEQLVIMAFGMLANSLLTSAGIEQLLSIMQNYAPKHLLRRLLNVETSTARAAFEMLLKNVVSRGDEDALDFLLAFEIRKELLSGIEGAQLLEQSIIYGEFEMAKRIVLAGADPNFGNEWWKPLFRAVEAQDLEFVEILLKAGAEVNHGCDEPGQAALSEAVRINNDRFVSMLLESGATVDTCLGEDTEGWNCGYEFCPTLPVLDYAYFMGYTSVYRLLLARSTRAHLTISGIVNAARAGLNQLQVYLERRVYDNAKERTSLLENALSSAIRHKTDDTAIYVLLEFGVDPNTPTMDRCDQLPLCQAIPDDHLVRRLLHAGAGLDKPEIILAAADKEENFDCLGLLIMNGLNLRALGSVGLGKAISKGNMDIVKLLLRSGAPATGYVPDGLSLVAVAARNRNREALHLLLQHGADINDGGHNGLRPINSAVAKGDLEIAKFLVENGALLDHSGFHDKRCRTVLEEWAAEVEQLRIPDLFTFLLENGAPVNAPEVKGCAPHWNSLLTTLILRSAEDYLIRQVLEKGAHVNGRLPTKKLARTPIQAAAQMGRLDLVREFHEKGADINASPGFRYGRTALQAACSAERANMEVVVYLLDNKADINARAGCEGGLTALQGAAIRGNIKLVTLLLDRGADVNGEAAIRNGRMALDGAAEHGRLDMVHLLLSVGAKCQREGTTGYDSAIELAKKQGHWEIAKLLLSLGGDSS